MKKKLRTKFQDEDFELGEVVDADVNGNYNRIVVFVSKDGGGSHTFNYRYIEDLENDFEEVE